MKSKINKERDKGITLIALVLTIIVLLILAGVSIATLSGENGIITQANKAKEETKINELKERLELIGVDVYQRNYMLADEEYMIKYEEAIRADKIFKKAQSIERNGVEIDIVSEEGYAFYIAKNKVTYVGKKGDKLPELEITVTANEIKQKQVTLTINSQNNSQKRIEYKVYKDGIEIASISSREATFTYDMKTTFGTNQVYVKAVNESEEIKSNQIEIEDNMIETLGELRKFRDDVNSGNSYEGKTITQIGNIDVQGNEENKWIPVGNLNHTFKGTYNGNNNVIQNIYINTEQNEQGFFGVNEGTIKNIGIESGSITAGDNTGSIVGVNTAGTIERCYNKVTINATGFKIAGICGQTNMGTIKQCYNAGDVTGNIIKTWGRTCGIVAENVSGTVEECYNTGNITTITSAENARAGGITNTSYHFLNSKVSSCYNTGTIKIIATDATTLGGPVAAGIVTQIEGDAIVENCYNIGKTKIEGVAGTRRGAIGGYAAKGENIINCYWQTGTAERGIPEISEGADNTTEKSIEEMKKIAGLLGDKFKEDINNINNGYPILNWQ